jgi:UDP-N-acetylmuramyl tripeptide synthase
VLSDVLTTPEGAFPLTLLLPGDFNRSNAAMALAAAHLSGVEWNQALGRVSSVTEVAGRFSRRVWQGRTWRILLAKNPAGVAALLQSVVLSGADVVVDINDGLADGLDPSWIYDAPFELLRGRMVWCEGSRQLDVATRLSYDDVTVSIASELSREVPPGDVIDVIANYTAFAKWIERSSPC